ncbi:MAG: endo-1,4-beta-xylanase [Fimbriimonas sp.]
MVLALLFLSQVGSDLIGNAPMRVSPGNIASGEGMARGGRITVRQRGENAYSAELKTPPFALALGKGDLIYVRFDIRSPSSKNESGLGVWNVAMQRGKAPYDGWGYGSGSVGRQWKTFHYAYRTDKEYPAGETELTLHVGLAEQELEVRNLQAMNLGPNAKETDIPANTFTYAGREASAPWRAKADAMIRANRMAPIRVVVTENGKPKANQPVHVQMRRHSYPFGTFIEYHVFDQKSRADSEKFLAIVNNRRFSRVTVPIYWSDWGWETNRQGYLDTIRWCAERGIRMKAHNILWPSEKYWPKRLNGLDDNQLRTAIFSAMDERLTTLKPWQFENIDVLNELKTEKTVENRLGFDALTETFRRTRLAFPKADLVYNDFAVFEGNDGGGKSFEEASRITKKLLSAGAPVTLSGWQAHFGEDATSPERVWALIDRWKQETGLPLEITEYDLNSRDETIKADYLRDLLTAWFAHPNTRGFTMWGFWEGSHWLPASAIYAKDWTPRPAVKVWDDLVTKKWWTDQTLKTNAKGEVELRGFLGDYTITSGAKKKAVTVVRGGTTVRM